MALTLTNDILKFRESTSDPWEKLLIQANMNFNLIYPVGSIYMSTVNVDPGTIFGGTWEQLKDTFLLGAGDSYTAGDTGGEAEHQLSTAEMPSHTHLIYGGNQVNPPDWFGGSGNAYGIMQRLGDGYDYLQYVGGNQAHNNMPPYLVVYMWRRLTLSPTIYTPPASVLIGDVACEDIVPVAKGGTGADNAADARANLGALAREDITTAVQYTATTDSWGQFEVPSAVVDATSQLVLAVYALDKFVRWRATGQGTIAVQITENSSAFTPATGQSITIYIYVL